VALGMGGFAKRRLLDFQPDIMHIAAPDLLGQAALALAQAHNIPAVASYHTRYETYLRHYWYLAFLEGTLKRSLRRFYGACREVYVPSDSVRETLLADGLKDNFKPWPRGIDTARFAPDKRDPAWRARHGIGPDELVILHVSRLVREKRLDTLTAALKQFDLPHRVVIVGDGPDRDLAQRELPHAVFTGFLDGNELAAAFASSDIFLFPSDTESFGNVTLEAMASGLPCVCADATGSRSLVVDGETGFLAHADDAEGFARHLTRLAQDSALRLRMGAAARSRALGFSWEETLARMLGYYRALLARIPTP
jgi:glycosyltransferase involved in cell wall biosynthesis